MSEASVSDTATPAALAWVRADARRSDVAVALVTVGIASLLLAGAPERFDTGWPEVVAGIGAFGLLLFRRRWPFAVLAVAVAWTFGHVVTLERPTPMIFAVVVLLATACGRLERWPAIGLGVTVAASIYLAGLITVGYEFGDARAVIGIAWTAGAVGFADASRSWRRYRESAAAEVRAAVLAAEAQTRQQVSEERLEIARELHDLLAHNLSVMNVQTGAALHLLRSDPDQAEVSLTAARDAGRSVLDELRDLLGVLRHEGDDEAPTASLPSIDRLPALVDTMRAAGLRLDWADTGAPRPLAPAVSLAAYRVVQEGLTNAAKHGTGSATLATEWNEKGITIVIGNQVAESDGTGLDHQGGHGLIGMKERTAANGGHIVVDALDGRFMVEAWLPAALDQESSP